LLRDAYPNLRSGPPAEVGGPFFPSGGLMSYGTDGAETVGQVGVNTGSILKGAKPGQCAGCPASTKFEFVIILGTAKALGLTIPETLLATADEVIQ
jgi:putative ABC transport system substrate-binding protein